MSPLDCQLDVQILKNPHNYGLENAFEGELGGALGTPNLKYNFGHGLGRKLRVRLAIVLESLGVLILVLKRAYDWALARFLEDSSQSRPRLASLVLVSRGYKKSSKFLSLRFQFPCSQGYIVS